MCIRQGEQMDLLRQFNQYWGENRSLIQKALTSAAASAEPLIPQHLEQIITNAVPRLSPTVALMTPKFDNQKLHEFNRMSTLPGAGGAMGESAVTPTYQPIYQRASVSLKVIRRKGATTNFLQDASKKNIDAAAANIEANVLAHVYDLENYIQFGNASSNTYEFSGWDTFITTNRTNLALGGVVPTSLKTLDDLIDANLEKQGMSHNKAFIMSPQMLSKFSQLLTNVRLNQGMGGFGTMDISGGWRLNAYRDIPIIVSSSCRPRVTMGTVVATTATTGGSIADSTTHYFTVSAVTKDGETLCFQVGALTTTGGNVSTATLTFTAVADAFRYKIYYHASTQASAVLISVVPAFTYDANGTITGSTNNTINTNSIVYSGADGAVTSVLLKTVSAHTEVSTAMQADLPLKATASVSPEYLWLIDLDEYQGLGRLPYTNSGGSQFNGLVTLEDLARTDDFLPFLIKTYCAIADSYEATSAVIRGLRVA